MSSELSSATGRWDGTLVVCVSLHLLCPLPRPRLDGERNRVEKSRVEEHGEILATRVERCVTR